MSGIREARSNKSRWCRQGHAHAQDTHIEDEDCSCVTPEGVCSAVGVCVVVTRTPTYVNRRQLDGLLLVLFRCEGRIHRQT